MIDAIDGLAKMTGRKRPHLRQQTLLLHAWRESLKCEPAKVQHGVSVIAAEQ
jgi:hypothetical protein